MRTTLTIAGSDPTGGAGIQADLQVFSSLGCHGAAAITALTVQDTRGVHATHHVPPECVRDQLVCLLADVRVDAIKTGMLGLGATAEAVAGVLEAYPETPLVVDPVLRSTSGSPLLDDAGLIILQQRLIPIATLVTPNLDEAELLTGLQVRSLRQMRDCARRLTDLGAKAALVKGGHLPGDPVDVLCIAGECRDLPGSRVDRHAVHGTGCALAGAAAVFLAEGRPMLQAVERAKAYVAAGLAAAHAIGRGSDVLDYAAAARDIGP
ncbi:MAG: bifunctional hydroxymethylpyrimidine kinase/phosphomethylpyrimidine kinase [Armatimonadetes bacterium]|nr:bifunctional hydroxymethylpyrimidine kinase/phosphomethylpyrimidine kinase [Armatimonadota bacterium]